MIVTIISRGDGADHRQIAATHLVDGVARLSMPDDPDATIECDTLCVVEMPAITDAADREVQVQLTAQGWHLV
jgi:hypothetical protein